MESIITRIRQKLCRHDWQFLRVAEASGGYMTKRTWRVELRCCKCGKHQICTTNVRPRQDGACL